ncbi:MAG: UMP kinase [Promethearchaeota archaeon]
MKEPRYSMGHPNFNLPTLDQRTCGVGCHNDYSPLGNSLMDSWGKSLSHTPYPLGIMRTTKRILRISRYIHPMVKRQIVVKMGGSLLFDADLAIRSEIMTQLSAIFNESTDLAAVIVGGGKIARKYIQAAREFNANESQCDTFGIGASRLNASLVIATLGDKAYPQPIEHPKEVAVAAQFNKVLVAGGFIPGQSTTSVTFQIAEILNATDVVILTDVDGIYDKDPHQHPGAKKFDEISIPQLEKVIYGQGGDTQAAAGEYRILDAVSLQILKRSHFNVRLTDGANFETLRQLLVDNRFDLSIGTNIISK